MILPIPDKKLSEAVCPHPFAAVITSMETYLSDTFINLVMKEKRSKEDLWKPIRICDRKLNRCDIFDRHNDINNEISAYYKFTRCFTTCKINLMYKHVLHVEFPKDLAYVFGLLKQA